MVKSTEVQVSIDRRIESTEVLLLNIKKDPTGTTFFHVRIFPQYYRLMPDMIYLRKEHISLPGSRCAVSISMNLSKEA
ncbi:MAG: hypothetical protein H6Q94_1265 [Nitrospirae bacterium]|nr:hypothetical protein [Nitrospirota bacterium]